MGLVKKWKKIKGFEKYKISNYGEVFSTYSNRLLSTRTSKSGTIMVDLYKNGKSEHFTLYKLVTKHFNNSWTEKKSYAIHLNLNRKNNKESNLEAKSLGDMLRFWNQKKNRVRGVSKWEKKNNKGEVMYSKYRAVIKHKNKVKTIGYFDTEYDAAIEYFMEYKKLYKHYPYDPKLLLRHYVNV